MQPNLSNLGISSINSSEGHTLANLKNIIQLLSLLLGEKTKEEWMEKESEIDFFTSKRSLYQNAVRLFGESKRGNNTRIMVTMPSEAADDFPLIKKLLTAGMDIARINTSHDDPKVWKAIIRNIKKGEAKTGKRCPIYMDLSGPRLRTGIVEVRKIQKKHSERIIDFILLKKGDILHVHRHPIIGRDAVYYDDGALVMPARIAVSIPSVFNDVKTGHKIWFDDGTIGGEILKVTVDRLEIKIFHANINGSRLRAEKGINLPDTYLNLPSLTEEDMEILPFITEHADLVGYSFVREPKDIDYLHEELKKSEREDIGLIVKIENKKAFDNLPNLMLAAMKLPNIGVMIARGDLAVEIGWERIAEVQEQILWLCEAAHTPIIWATQVLEKLAKKGIATRAEITDAAMSAKTECVMLNKGAYILEAVKTLDNILQRMKYHSVKKKGTLRSLKVAKRFFQNKK